MLLDICVDAAVRVMVVYVTCDHACSMVDVNKKEGGSRDRGYAASWSSHVNVPVPPPHLVLTKAAERPLRSMQPGERARGSETLIGTVSDAGRCLRERVV